MIMYDAQLCAEVFFELGIDEKVLDDTKEIFAQNPILADVLSNPSVTIDEKYAVIDKLFERRITDFLKVMTEFGHIAKIDEILDACSERILQSRNILKAELSYVTKPSDEMQESFRQTLKQKYGVSDVLLTLKEDKCLIGGYKLTVGDTEYDKSIQGTVKALQNKLIRR